MYTRKDYIATAKVLHDLFGASEVVTDPAWYRSTRPATWAALFVELRDQVGYDDLRVYKRRPRS